MKALRMVLASILPAFGLGFACGDVSDSAFHGGTGKVPPAAAGGSVGRAGAGGTKANGASGMPSGTGGASGTGGLGSAGTSGTEGGASPPNDASATGGSGGSNDGGQARCVLTAPGATVSKWAAPAGDGTLSYATTTTGDQLLDFSNAGYMGGGVALPQVQVARSVQPSTGDDTAAIQAAIDAVSKLPLAGGFRGAVLLEPGTFQVSATIGIHASGVVLRGSGPGSGGTVLEISGNPRTAVVVSGTGSWATTGRAANITDAYVPAGAHSFNVDDASGFAVGNTVLVERPVTDAWIHFINRDTLVRDGARQTWLGNSTIIHSDRVVTGISGSTVTVDAPLSDSLDRKYVSPPGAKLVRYTFNGRIEQAGVEALRLVAPRQASATNGSGFSAISMDALQNGFIRDVAAEEFISGINLGDGAKWVTVADSSLTRTTPIDGSAGYPFQFSVSGQQTLVLRCRTTGPSAFSYATQARTPGPNVVLGLVARGSNSWLQPHQRWATGLLVDSCDVSDSSIDLMNRGTYGSGHGWTMGFGVVWNSKAKSLLVQSPPGAPNWAIGSSGVSDDRDAPGGDGRPEARGVFDSHAQPVLPTSLYLAQLCLRLGSQAVKNIGAAP